MQGIVDRHVIITGAGGGIGRTLVETFGRAGARVTACDRDPDALAPLQAKEKFAFDLTDPDAAAQALAHAGERQGPPQILVGNAGFTRAETLLQTDQRAWDAELAINLTGTYNFVTPALNGMMNAGGGAIVLIATVNALAHYGNPAYSAAKAGLLAFARAIALEYGKHNIRANCICPGSVHTPAWDHRLAANPTLLDTVASHYPLGRLVSPQEVANTALFLASSLASGITGVALPVDAGLSAGNLHFIRDVIGE